ncbi:MAG: hypothetical protein JWL63_3498 [Rhodocyclales bacterium]|nr:hypothetical protein [Rhodocyclales bacterium]
MPMESRASSPIAAPVALSTDKTADAVQIADAMVSTWLEIDAALRPIIGQGGVAALYKRTLYLTAPTHAWLASTHEGVHAPMDLTTLKGVLAQQSNADAAAGSRAILHTFNELLTSLVGPSLTERLLRSMWANSFSGSPAQDSSP